MRRVGAMRVSVSRSSGPHTVCVDRQGLLRNLTIPLARAERFAFEQPEIIWQIMRCQSERINVAAPIKGPHIQIFESHESHISSELLDR